jgi:hypothetical protein
MIICLSGYAGSGKDTFAKLLAPEFKRIAIADKIRELVYELNANMYTVGSGKHGWTHTTQQLVDQFGWEEAKREYPDLRTELWETGKVAKRVFGETFWLEQAFGPEECWRDTVVTDVRFKYEIDWLGSAVTPELKVVNVTRPGLYASTTHEADMEGFEYDYTLKNAGSVEDLQSFADLFKLFATK